MTQSRQAIAGGLAALLLLAGALLYFFLRGDDPKTTPRSPQDGPCQRHDQCDEGLVCCGDRCTTNDDCDQRIDSELPLPIKPTRPARPRRDLRELDPAPSQADRDARVKALTTSECQNNKDCATGLMTCDPSGQCKEPDICWSDGDCLGARKCFKGRCTDKVDGCRTKDCPDGWRCDAPRGACESYHCRSDAECAGGRRCLPTGLCADCIEDTDCPEGKVCYSSRCKAPDACHGDGGCEEGTICDPRSWNCVDPKLCVDDDMEDNDKRSEAKPLEPGTYDLRLCHRDHDWFKIDVQAQESILITAEYTVGHGHMELRSFDERGIERGRAGDTEVNGYMVLPIEEVQEDLSLYLQIHNSSGASMQYTLRVQRAPRPFCADDEYEPNDLQEEARPLHQKLHYIARLCDGRDDWFYADLDEGQTLNAILDVESGQVPLLEIYEEGELARVAYDDSQEAPKSLQHKAKNKTRHYVRVFPRYLDDTSTYVIMLQR
jgi:hypothetical protein